MKNSNWIRTQVKKYLAHPRAMSQIELARAVNIPRSTFSEYINGKEIKIDHDMERKIIAIVAPWEHDVQVVVGHIKSRLLKDRRTQDEIRLIALEMAKEYQKTA